MAKISGHDGMKGTGMALGLALLALGGLSGCGNTEAVYPTKGPGKYDDTVWKAPGDPSQRQTVFGEGGLFGGSKDTGGAGGGNGVAVNTYLWRATLDTISFMPLASADPFGGVVITDWYSFPESADERFKVNVFIVSKALRADGVKVSVFREVRGPGGDWQAAEVDPQTVTGLENSILKGARELRMANRAAQ